MTQDRIRLVLADDHAVVLDALCRLLRDSFDIVGLAENGKELLAQVARTRPEVVITDIGMPLMNGLAALKAIRQLDNPPSTIMLSMHADRRLVADAFRVGASGYVLKGSAGAELVDAVSEVRAGRRYVSARLQPLEASHEEAGTRSFMSAASGRLRSDAESQGRRAERRRAAIHLTARDVRSAPARAGISPD